MPFGNWRRYTSKSAAAVGLVPSTHASGKRGSVAEKGEKTL